MGDIGVDVRNEASLKPNKARYGALISIISGPKPTAVPVFLDSQEEEVKILLAHVYEIILLI